jgi:hypothetical protein
VEEQMPARYEMSTKPPDPLRAGVFVIGGWIIFAFFAAGEGSPQDLFQVGFHSGGSILAQEAPVERAGHLVFRRHPDGVLISVRKPEVAHTIPVHVQPARTPRPGERVDIGFTGEGPS